MATRFYLPASGTPPLASLAVNSNWELTNGLVRLPCFTAKQNTALATDARTWPATITQQWCWRQYQSEILAEAYNWTTADTVSMVVGKCGEPSALTADTHLVYVVKVVSGDGTVVRGNIGLLLTASTEFPNVASAATRIHSARTNGAATFSSQVGDRIIVEIGVQGVTPAAVQVQMRFGDPTATGDFALTAGLTTDLDPWVELSRTVTFGTPPATLVVQDAALALAAESQALVQHNILVVADALSALAADGPALTQHSVLLVADALLAIAAEAPTLTVHDPATQLVVQDALLALGIDSPSLTQHNALAVADALLSLAADGVALTQHNVIAVADALLALAADNIVLELPGVLAPQDATIALSVDNVTLVQHSVLVVQDALIGLMADAMSFASEHEEEQPMPSPQLFLQMTVAAEDEAEALLEDAFLF